MDRGVISVGVNNADAEVSGISYRARRRPPKVYMRKDVTSLSGISLRQKVMDKSEEKRNLWSANSTGISDCLSEDFLDYRLLKMLKFQIDFVHGDAPVARVTVSISTSPKMQELSTQLKELSDSRIYRVCNTFSTKKETEYEAIDMVRVVERTMTVRIDIIPGKAKRGGDALVSKGRSKPLTDLFEPWIMTIGLINLPKQIFECSIGSLKGFEMTKKEAKTVKKPTRTGKDKVQEQSANQTQ
ncbi:hypothetical protein Tco_0227608 [Tanacetum coccineum]